MPGGAPGKRSRRHGYSKADAMSVTSSRRSGDLSTLSDLTRNNPDLFDWILSRDRRPLPQPTKEQIRVRMGSAFLVQLNITHAGLALGVSAYAGLMDTLAGYMLVPGIVAFVLWILSATLAIVVFSLLIVRAFRYPHLLKRDFTSNKYTSFFASPAIVMGGLATSVPQAFNNQTVLRVVFYGLLAYQTVLALYWYGDWLFATGYSLRMVHTTYFMATTEFFVLGYLGALIHLDDLAKISLHTGILFWIVVFIAVFQFLSKTLADNDEKATPTMFLFIADEFTWFFCSATLFIYLLLIRVFRQYWTRRFSVTWWAYIFPLSTAANLAAKVAYEVDLPVPWAFAVLATIMATVMISVVAALTMRAIAQGNLPRDDNSIRAHYQKLIDKEIEAKRNLMAQSQASLTPFDEDDTNFELDGDNAI